MKKALLIVAVLLLAIGGYIGYGKYEQQRFVETLVPHVKNSSLRVSNSTRYESEEDSKITYKELLEKLEGDIQEIDKRIIEIQSLSTPKTAATTDPTVAYLKASQEYIRALLQKYRKMLALSSAMDWSRKSLDELRASTTYGFEYAKRSSDKAIKDLGEAEKEYNDSIPELVATVAKLQEARKGVASLFPEDALIPAAQRKRAALPSSLRL